MDDLERFLHSHGPKKPFTGWPASDWMPQKGDYFMVSANRKIQCRSYTDCLWQCVSYTASSVIGKRSSGPRYEHQNQTVVFAKPEYHFYPVDDDLIVAMTEGE